MKGINRSKFNEMLVKDPIIKEWMYQMGLMKRSQYQVENADFDDVDSDLEVEIDVRNQKRDERIQKIKEGIEHIPQEMKQGLINFSDENTRSPDDSLPWASQILEAFKDSNIKSTSNRPSNAYLQIEHVYGYRGFDTRNNVKYGPKNQIIYHAGALGIVLDP